MTPTIFRPLLATAALAALLTAAPAFAGEGLANLHVEKGLKCETCHGNDKANMKEPTTQDCAACHNLDQIVDSTKDVKPTNPHFSKHYGKELDCNNCHLMHQESENYCNQCHEFGFKVP